MNDVVIIKGKNGLNRRQPSDDMICGYVVQGLAVTGGAQLSTAGVTYIYELIQPKDAEDIGLDAAYDDTNKVLVYHNIVEHFRMNPDSKILLMLVARTVTLTQMADKALNFAKKLLTMSEGRIRIVTLGLNPITGYTPTLTTGLDADVLTAIPKAQALADEEYDLHRPVSIVIEGRNFNGTVSSAINLRAQAAKDVMVVIGADPAISALKVEYNTYAAIGAVTGALSRKVSNNIGWTEEYNLTGDGKFLSAGLSSNLATKTYSDADQDTLNTKGFVFVKTFTDYDGVYFNDSHTCTLVSDDYAYMENNLTINKAVRLIRKKLLPKLNSPLKVNPTTGKISPEVSKSFESLGNSSLDGMVSDEELSGKDLYVDPNQNILSSSELVVQAELIPIGVGRKIKVNIGFKNPF